MSKPKNHNLFAGDKAYQTNRFLTFKSNSTEEKFQADTFLRTRYFLQGYILICLSYVIFNTLVSDCFNFYHNCRHTVLLIFTAILLITSYIPVKMKNAGLVRMFLLIPSLYIHLIVLDNNSYHVAIHLIVIQTTLTSGLTLSSWKLHVFYNVTAYGLVALSIKYLETEFLVQGCVTGFFKDLLLYSLIPMTLMTYIEKGRRERWVLLETFKRSERSFMMLAEKIKSPVFVLDSRKKVIFANQKALNILKNYFPNISPRVPINKLNIEFSNILTLQSKALFETAIEESIQEEGSIKKISLKDPEAGAQENPSNSVQNMNAEEVKVEELIEESDHIYEMSCVRTLWKNSHAYLVSVQDITDPVKVQASVSTSYIQSIQNIRDYIEAAQTTFENMINISIANPVHRPLLQAVSNMDSLQYSILNTSAVFDITQDKFKAENNLFDIRETIVYILELLSIKSTKQKVEMSLKFEAGFPDQVTGDCFRFAQMFHNMISSVIEGSKEVKIEMQCNVKALLTSQGKFLLEFSVEFPESETLKFEEIKRLNEEEEECSVDILKKTDKEIKILLFKPLVKKLNGEIRAENKDTTMEVKFEMPFDNADPSPTHKISNRKSWNLPIMTKFNMTNTKTKVSKNAFTWSAVPMPVSTDLQLSGEMQSPFVQNQKLSERIKLQFTDTQSSSSTNSIQQMNTGLKSQVKTPNYEEFKKNKANLMKFTGGGKDIDHHMNAKYDQTDSEAGSRRESREFEAEKRDEIKIDTKPYQAPTLHLHEVIKSPKEAFKEANKLAQSDAIALNIKRQKSVRDKQEHLDNHLKDHAEKKPLEPIKEESKSEKEEKPKKANKRNSREDPQIRIEEASPTMKKDSDRMFEESHGFLRTSDIDIESLHRGINRVKRGKRKSKSISNRDAKSDPEEQNSEKDSEKPKTANNYKPIRPSYFSPGSPQDEMLAIPTDESIKASSEGRKGSSQSEGVDEEVYVVTRNRLKINENNLKIAVGNILLGILTMYGPRKRVSTATSHSKLSDQKEERKNDESKRSSTNMKDENKNQDTLAPTNGEETKEDKEIEKVIKESMKNGGLNANEFIDRIIELLASRIVIEKNEKEFMTFLAQYVKQVEKKLHHHDFRTYNRGSMNSLDDEEDKPIQDRVIFPSHLGSTLQEELARYGHRSMLVTKRKNSDDSIFSLNSDAGERNLNLAERMLVAPSVMALLRDKGQARKLHKKKFSTPGDVSEDESYIDSGKKWVAGEGSPSNLGESNILTTKITEGPDRDEFSQRIEMKDSLFSKEEREKELIPFDYQLFQLPAYITVRIETQKRSWTGGQIKLQEIEFKEFSYLEDFTILVVDDNAYVFKGLELATCSYKKNLDYAKNGLEGFSKYKSLIEQNFMYHIIFMDVLMPICDGLEATKMIREYEAANKCPRTFICAVSSFEDEATKRKCLEAGMDDYCCKPIGAQTLSQLILSRCQTLNIAPSIEA